MPPPAPLVVFPNVVTIAIGAMTWLLGVFIVRRVTFLSRYSFPAPVVGGLAVAILFGVVHARGTPLPKFNTELINSLIIGFFASLGFGASLQELRQGGREVIKYLAACSVLLFLQAMLGVLVAQIVGYPSLFGVLTSIVSLAGGPGTALAFAPAFEAQGIENAATIGLAAAMGGTLLGGVLAAPLGTILIERMHLRPKKGEPRSSKSELDTDKSDWISPDEISAQLVWHAAYLLIVGSIGWYVSKGLASAGIKLPFYIGAMVIASIVRNVDDATRFINLNVKMTDAIGATCLTFFIATMMMSMELWALASMAGVLLIMLAVQTIFVLAAAATIMVRVAGKDYDAAVMSSGLVGFMLGTTATSLAAMSSLTQKYGPAPRAFLVVPIVGACFIDFVNAMVISLCLNMFG